MTTKTNQSEAKTGSKHTPGPWKVKGEDIVANGRWIACAGNFNVAENKQNAALIAAAPELLEALRKLSELLRTINDVNDKANVLVKVASSIMVVDRAIRKTKGE